MSDNNAFFRWVWRFNGLVLALAALGSLVLIGYVQWRVWSHQNDYDKPSGVFAPVPQAAEKNATYRVEEEPYGGSAILTDGNVRERLLPLRRWEGAPAPYGISSVYAQKVVEPRLGAENAVNLLIVNADTGQSRWMFTGYDRRIYSEEAIYNTEPPPAEPYGYAQAALSPANAVVLWVKDHDDNHDGKLDEKDHTSLFVYRPGAAKPVNFLTATLIISTRQIGTDKYQVVYENGKTALVATYAIADFKLLSQEPLPKVPN